MSDLRRPAPELIFAGDPPFPALRDFLEVLRSSSDRRSAGPGVAHRRDRPDGLPRSSAEDALIMPNSGEAASGADLSSSTLGSAEGSATVRPLTMPQVLLAEARP